jgi:membrane-bound lytic murein transglycosylase D
MWKKIALLVAIPVVFSACAGTRSTSKSTQQRHYRAGHYAIPKSDIPLVTNDKVLAWVDYFSGPGRDRFSRYMKRSGRYTPMMRQILKSYGLPQDLIYLAMIESGFATKAKSHASAVGVWQFIRATGNRYGLDQDSWIDERQDAEKATHAAAQYLRDLYNEFGDWYLAMAAYNSGEGTVRRGIARTGTKDFWEMSHPRTGVFRAETRDYVPKFIAAAIVAKHPEQFGLANVLVDAPISYETVTVDTHVDIDVIAKCAGVDVETIDILNSELKIGTAPPQYKVKVPPGTTKKFQVALARIPAGDRVSTMAMSERYTVAKRDTLHKIAKRFGVTPSKLLAANGLRNARSVKSGMTLTIPVGDMKSALVANAGRSKSFKQIATQPDETITPVVDAGTISSGYVVAAGDSWNAVAQNVGISTKKLKQINPELAASGLHVGDVVRLSGAPQQMAVVANDIVPVDAAVASDVQVQTVEKVMVETVDVETPITTVSEARGAANAKSIKASHYKVRPGDSLDKIAQRHGVTVSNLRAWNQLNKDHIRPGQKLVITAPTQAKQSTVRVGAKSARLENVSEETPAARKSVEKPVKNATKNSKVVTYKVKPGDNLWTIGKKHKISSEQLKQLSQLNKSGLRPGDVITFRAGS